MHEMELRIRENVCRCSGAGVSRPLFHGNFFLAYNGLHSYKPAVDDLWHPLSPAHGLPRISASENIIF